jgi:predicted anti-sigma-YlaC factor YlaD
MNDTTLPGPCAGYEFEIVELHEGALGPDAALRVKTHLEGCARCRDWQSQYAALDATLARELPRPQLSADFGAMLRERLAGIADPATRRDLRSAVEREHDWMVRDLRRAARRRAIIGGVVGATVAAAGVALAVVFGPEAASILRTLDAGNSRAMFGALAAAAVIGSLAWSATRGVLPGVRLIG